MNQFEKTIESNIFFFKSNFSNVDTDGILLYDIFHSQKQLIYGISKVALATAKKLNLRPVGMEALRLNSETLKFAKSINPNTIDLKVPLLRGLFKHFFALLKLVLNINSKAKLLKLEMDGINIGPYIYDSLLRTFGLPEVNSFNFAIRKRIILEILHYYCFRTLLMNTKIKFVVMGDNVYRNGLLFELCRANNIPCIAAIDLNAVSMAKYTEKDDYKVHPRQVTPAIIRKIKDAVNIDSALNEYMNKRLGGKIMQHDVISAYGNKTTRSRSEFSSKYNLIEELPTVVIMAHIFSDAPHGYPMTLYDDYLDWFQSTLQVLMKNKSINLLVKEHPSGILYGEEGLMSDILKKFNLEHIMISSDESTNSILQHANVIVTCGGTIGLEFSMLGKNVVLASCPPYSKLGFTFEFETIKAYEDFLKVEIHNLKPLNSEQQKKAMMTAWISFELYNNYSEDLELGSETIMLGKVYNDELFYNKIIQTNEIPLIEQKIYSVMEDFLGSPYKAMINKMKLQYIGINDGHN